MLATDTLAGALVYLVIFIVLHVIMMGVSDTFAMSHAGIFTAAFFTGSLSFLAFRGACLGGKIR